MLDIEDKNIKIKLLGADNQKIMPD